MALSADDFRVKRAMLPPSAFALTDGKPDPAPTDLVPEEVWQHFMDLPTDVALRTTSYQGTVTAAIYSIYNSWLEAGPLEEHEAPFMHEASVSGAEEFYAMAFNAIHGLYRQAFGCLRNALELLVHSAACAVQDDTSLFSQWRSGRELRFQTSCKELQNSNAGSSLNKDLGGVAFFVASNKRRTWTQQLYKRLSGYAHSKAGSSNPDFWMSNGPIYVPDAYGRVLNELRETAALGCVLMRLGWQDYKLPRAMRGLYTNPGPDWSDFADRLLQFFED